jgi:HSP20 family protein
MDFKALTPWRAKSQSPSSRDDELDPFVALRREMDRMFDEFFNNFGGRSLRPLVGGGQGVTPTIDVRETDKDVVVTAELPGLDQKDFDVTLSGDILTIRGEKKVEQEQKVGHRNYLERQFGAFSRSLRLPFEVKDEEVEARYDKGVLTVRVPKPADAQKAARRIEIKAA